MNCMKEQSINNNVIIRYVQVYVTQIFRLITFSLWKGAIYKVVNLQATFMWTFLDVFIMCVGMYLSNLFRDINKIISVQVAQNSVEWSSIRQHYSQVMKLLKQANKNLSFLILLSFFTNIYYVCLQMYYSIHRVYDSHKGCPQEDVILSIDGIEYNAYYIFSLLFLLLRSFMTSMMAVQVNTEALKPLTVLRNIQTQEYTLDVQRFIRQIQYCNPALSGICFSVTKKMLFSAIATVVTYEVVLLQNSRTRAMSYDGEYEMHKNETTFLHYIY
ncbi:gustatory receptor 5a for trehalose-like [Pieris napi]|uniref:gustatory receptor 5a for trehalose-like n=1 Tax=Pieris napi TaxID=78633 RepID=UPI001FB8E6EA|nr:gustatory receptor 5a for trehalose-like [Pieris napi]